MRPFKFDIEHVDIGWTHSVEREKEVPHGTAD
jgi:hypothetical protein